MPARQNLYLSEFMMARHVVAWGVTAILAIALGVSVTTSVGGPVAVQQWLHGEVVQIEPPLLQISKDDRRARKAMSVSMRNLSGRPLKILGSRTTCDCAAAEPLPSQVDPFGVIQIPIVTSDSARGSQTLTFYTDAPQTPQIHVHVVFLEN